MLCRSQLKGSASLATNFNWFEMNERRIPFIPIAFVYDCRVSGNNHAF